ncbi:hypothetical protein [Mycobacterium sp. KBS0706]|uniref:COG4315 family predicted lipoprotein n=1 Tax=Mycobacterium sp. KBS0706 TaxID=2578109 RepID=UPI00163D9DD8|nr:hypothetical protein [Mycobacterium sp. KBS0706]
MKAANLAGLLLGAITGACGSVAPTVEPPKMAAIERAPGFVDARGMTLYVYDRDAPNQSNCDGLCAVFWPPLTASASSRPPAGWSLAARNDGSKQWAYQGRPLYTWTGDRKPGEGTGDGVDGVWQIARP